MIVKNINNFHNGWFIGDFNPSVFKNPFFEMAHHHHKAGYKTPRHTHKIAKELTYIVKGKLFVGGRTLKKGDMFLYEPNEIADAEVIEDVDVIVIKWPSIPSDKHMIGER